ncbi:hypothetical protein V1520DRAFT_207338 [Lipomyces starkeyi]|uniref:Uncharacterized protein n=1 Tax=Lipomyces starkeyi NRRL Y-11557 TaxID=675824 RepID=A0A1E3Q7D1_LIPST|nr:hypothetical protein LIPSTDRAFT_278263 [Lipomyces starkeyi NRRL Y-11557]
MRRKGGISSLAMGGMLQKLVSWSMLCSFIALQSAGQANLVQAAFSQLWTGTQQRLWQPEDALNPLENGFYEVSALHRDVNTVFSYLCQLSSIKRESQSTSEESLAFAERMDFAEQAIAQLLVDSTAADYDDSNGSLARSFGLASTIYLYIVLREIPLSFFIIGQLVNNLKAALEFDVFASVLPQWANKLFWVLVVGGLAALGCPEQSWFVARLSAWCGNFTQSIDEAVQIVLKESCWPEMDTGIKWKQQLAELVSTVAAEDKSWHEQVFSPDPKNRADGVNR